MTPAIEEAVPNYEALMCTLRTASMHELNTACSIMARAAHNAALDAAAEEVMTAKLSVFDHLVNNPQHVRAETEELVRQQFRAALLKRRL